jgi:hypothetical protein
MKNQHFFMVYLEEERTPTYRHATLEGAEQEAKRRTWKKGTNYFNIKKIGLQTDFFFGEGAGCNSGGCTD